MTEAMIGLRTMALPRSRMAVVGVGGAGCNIVSGVYESAMPVNTIAINTDEVALRSVHADRKVCIRDGDVCGGVRGDAVAGVLCAQAHEDSIMRSLEGNDVVFIVAGLGGGTGTGAVSVIAGLCDRLDILTFAIAVEPFSFEGSRCGLAAEGMKVLRSVCSHVSTVSNDLGIECMPDSTMDEVLAGINASVCRHISELADRIPQVLEEMLGAKTDDPGHGGSIGADSAFEIRPMAIQQF